MTHKHRIYSLSDTKVLALASTLVDRLESDIQIFQSFDDSFGQPMVDSLRLKISELTADETLDPKETTESHIKDMNELWTSMKEMGTIAQILFADDRAKQYTYLMPRCPKGKMKGIAVPLFESIRYVIQELTPEMELILYNPGKAPLQFYISENVNAEPIPNAVMVGVGETITVAAQDISDGTYGILFSVNKAEKQWGGYRVTIPIEDEYY